MKSMWAALLMFVVMVQSVGSLQAQQQKNVAGVWTVSVHDMALRLVLSQDGKKVTGTMESPHSGVFHLAGEFADGTLTLATTTEGDQTIQLSLSGTVQHDGSIAGDLKSSMGDLPWTAVRTPGK